MDWLFFPDDASPVPAAIEDWTFGATPVETWSVTQATGGYGRGADGRWALFAPNTPRTYYDPVTLADLGVLLEPESYQTVFKPRAVPLSLSGITRTEFPDQPCPFGVGTFKLAASAVNQIHSFNLLSGGGVAEHILDNTTVTAQWIIKPDGISRFAMFCQKRDGVYASVNFDMRENGSYTGAVGCTATIERDALGYYRMSMTLNSGVGTSTFRFGGQMMLDDGTKGFLGDGVKGFHVAYWGIERGDCMTSPSAANGTTSTLRAADSMLSAVPWVGSGPKSFGIQFAPLTGLDQTIFELGTADNLQLRIEGGLLRYAATTGTESVAFLSGPLASPRSSQTAVVTAGFNEFLLGHNGSLLGVDRIGAAPSNVTSMRLGSRLDGSNARPIAVRRMKFWNHALAENAVLEFSRDLNTAGVVDTETIVTIQPSITVPTDQNTVTFLVTLSQRDLLARVNYRTIGGTAISGVDFLDSVGTLSFLAGETSKEVTVQLGARAEDDRSFKFELNFPVHCAIDNAVCEVSLPRVVRVPPVTSLDILFTDSVGTEWTLTRPSPAPRRQASGLWGLLAANSPAAHWATPSVSGILVDSRGYDQRLFDSVVPNIILGSTSSIDLVTQTPVGTRSLIVTEGSGNEVHGVNVSMNATNSDIPTEDFTAWFMLEPHGRTRWQLSVKGRDNIWHDFRFNLTGAGAVLSFTPDAWIGLEQDPFFPGVYRIGVGKPQLAYAGVDPEFTLMAIDETDNSAIPGNPSNWLRIIHIQVESRIGWGEPLVAAGATAKTVRAPDDLRPNGTWHKRNTFSIGIQAVRLYDLPVIQRILHIRDIAPYQDDYGFYISSGVVGAPNTTGTVYNGIIPGAATVIYTPFAVILTVNPATRFALFQSGVFTGEQLFAGKIGPDVVDLMRIGARLDGTNLQAGAFLLQRLRYWTSDLNTAEGAHYSANLAAAPLPPPVIPPTVSVPTTLRIREGGLLTVPINKAGNGVCSVTYTTKAATAKFGVDYNGLGPLVMDFADTDTQKTFAVQTIADAVSDNAETFTVEISSPVGCTLGNSVCVVTITDPPIVSVPLTAAVKEGDVLTLTLTKTGEGPCSVAWETKAVKAQLGVDYVGVGNPAIVVNFGDTETVKTVQVQTLQDTVSDPNETFNVLLSAPNGCALGNATCLVTITDDEAATSGIYKRGVGFASAVNAGIGKTVYRVTSLADDNTAGTLRYGINQGSRHIIFEVAGVIQMTGDWSFTKSDVTVSGETAPYPGITIRGDADKGGNIRPGSSKRVHFSHINFERCHDARVVTNSNGDAVEIAPGAGLVAEDIEFRHCSFFWSNDECVSIWGTGGTGSCNRISFIDCLFAEPLYRPEDIGYRAHYEGGAIESNHNYGMILGARSFNIDVQYSMWTDTGWRCPFIDANSHVVLANNISLNSQKGAHISMNSYETPMKAFTVTLAGYLCISGPDTKHWDFGCLKIHSGNTIPPTGSKIWADGMYARKGSGATITPYTTINVSGTKAAIQASQRECILDPTKDARPLDIPGNPVPMLTEDEIYQRAIDNIGPFPKNRIPNVTRKIEHLKSQTGAYVNHQTEVNGPSSFTKVTRALDGKTKFSDNVAIPAYPSISATPTADDIKKVRDWLELFLVRIQYD